MCWIVKFLPPHHTSKSTFKKMFCLFWISVPELQPGNRNDLSKPYVNVFVSSRRVCFLRLLVWPWPRRTSSHARAQDSPERPYRFQTLEQIRVIRSLAHRNGSYKDRGKTNVQCCFHLQWLDSHYTGLGWTFVEIV